jgi:RHS repeat-associated protein
VLATASFHESSGHVGESLTWDMPAFVNARKIKIQLLGQNIVPDGILSLAEVQAFLICSRYQTAGQPDGIHHEITTRPDGTRSRNVYGGGRLMFSERRDNASAGIGNLVASTSYSYDVFGRTLATTDSRTGTTVTLYVSATCDRVASIIDPGGRVTSFTYDSRGRRVGTTLPDNSVTSTSYYPSGQVRATWGSLAYPTFTTYDYAGRIKTLHTWKTAPTLTQSTATPPDNSATTTWNYYDTTGWLLSKIDANNHGPEYTYTEAGRIATRVWARGGTTTYGYTNGRRTSVDYPGTTTPDVDYTYDRLGRPDTITQIATKTVNGITTHPVQSQITYSYAGDLTIDTETVSYDTDLSGTFELTRTLDRFARSLGRDTGWTLGSDNQATYTYDTSGRLSTVADATNTFTYGYLYNQTAANYPRAGSTSGSKQDFMPYTLTKSGSTTLQTLRTYEATRNALSVIQNKAGNDTRSSYTYTVNALGQRTDLTTAFNLGSGVTSNPGDTDWGYDSLGQLTAADLPGADIDRAYYFDTIGNRLTSAKGTFTTVNNATTFTAGTNGLTEYYGAVANSTPSDPGANALNQYAAIKTGTTIVQPGHDDDGNATAYPLPKYPAANSTLVWDAENRLISAAVNGVTTTYLYDALSRRIAKIPATGSATLYIHDGFNCIAEYTGTTLSKTRTWGLDLSGTLQGAGGVGGLLAEKQGGSYFYPTYDGNGNVSEYLAADGTTSAHFEYDPFGNTTVDTDSATTPLFAYRFSTKPLDFETGLYYYGYRYYDPLTGRWPSRDPIGEEGGLNLYGFVNNRPATSWDLFGNKLQSYNTDVQTLEFTDEESLAYGAAAVMRPKWPIVIAFNFSEDEGNTGTYIKDRYNDCDLFIRGSLSLELVKLRRLTERSPGGDGKSIGDHERAHAESYKKYWKMLMDDIDFIWEGDYGYDSADLAKVTKIKDFANYASAYFLSMVRVKETQSDVDGYGNIHMQLESELERQNKADLIKYKRDLDGAKTKYETAKANLPKK